MMEHIGHETTNVMEEGRILTPPMSPVGEYTSLDFSSIGQIAFSQDVDRVYRGSSPVTPPVSPRSIPEDEPVAERSESRQRRSIEGGESRRRRRIRTRVRHFLSLSHADTTDLTAATGLPPPVVRMVFAEARLRQIQRRIARQSGAVAGSLLTTNSRHRQKTVTTARMT